MFTRRNFIQGLAAAGTLVFACPQQLFASPAKKQIGIQLYTIRDLVKQDLAGSFKKLSEIGFSSIETAGYDNRMFYDLKPAKFKEMALGYGLNPISSHSAVSMENIDQSVEDAHNAGMKYIVLPWIPEDKRKNTDAYKKLAEELNKMGEICRAADLYLGYHNHDFEFQTLENGQVAYDLLLKETIPELVFMQIDTYWVVYAGYDPLDYFKRFPGRFALWHVKDMARGEKKETTELGSGSLNFPGYFEQRKLAGLQHVILEQEDFHMDPWDSLDISYQYLMSLNF